MPDWVDLLWAHTWSSYDAADRSWHGLFVHWFNLFEGCAWWTFGGLVLNRWLRRGASRWELAYAAAFFVFGLTDFLEAWSLASWLLWGKLANLIVLFRLRALAIARWYPGSRLY